MTAKPVFDDGDSDPRLSPLPPDDLAGGAQARQFYVDAVAAIALAQRVTDLRQASLTDEATLLFAEDAVLATWDNVVYGRQPIRMALLDQQRFVHVPRWFGKWRLVANTLEVFDAGGADVGVEDPAVVARGRAAMAVLPPEVAEGRYLMQQAPELRKFVVERQGTLKRSIHTMEMKYAAVQETVVVQDGRIVFMAHQLRPK